MQRRQKATITPLPADWRVLPEYQISPRRTLQENDVVRLKGMRGEYRFVQAIIRENGIEWLDFIELRSGKWKSVAPDHVKKIVRKAGISR